jgi:hypothetical protein
VVGKGITLPTGKPNGSNHITVYEIVFIDRIKEKIDERAFSL